MFNKTIVAFIAFFILFSMQSLLAQTVEYSVNTFLDRPIANVQMTNGVSTDMQGIALIDSGTVVMPILGDFDNNGSDLKDVILIRKHVLAQQLFTNNFQSLIADLSGDGIISAIDILFLQRAILKVNDAIEEWSFFQDSDNNFIGYKEGDVDDNASLLGDFVVWTGDLAVFPEALPIGLQTRIPFYLSDVSQSLLGVELHMRYDPTKIRIEQVIAPNISNVEFIFNEPVEGELIILIFNPNLLELDFEGIGTMLKDVFYIELTAFENIMTDEAFSLSQINPSFALNQDLEQEYLFTDIKGNVSTLEEESIEEEPKLIPNPVEDYLSIEFANEQNYRLDLFSSIGQKMNIKVDNGRVEVAHLPSGVYTYLISTEEKSYSGQIIVKH